MKTKLQRVKSFIQRQVESATQNKYRKAKSFDAITQLKKVLHKQTRDSRKRRKSKTKIRKN